jgi:hypothetical protein
MMISLFFSFLGKRILALSDSSKVIQDHHLLIKSLEDLMYEKTFDLSLIETSLIDQVIQFCLVLLNIYFSFNLKD